MKHRLRKIRSLLQTEQLDAILISSFATIRYLSSFLGFTPHERDAYILVTKKASYLFTNTLYSTAAREAVKHLSVKENTVASPLHAQLKKLIPTSATARVGFEADNLTVSEWKLFHSSIKKLIPISVSDLRVMKDIDELTHIMNACQIADKALQKILPKVQVDISEKEIQFLLEQEIRRLGGEIAFPTIVAFGKHAASPHHLCSETKLTKNDTVLIDFGARVQGYNSDMTRTFFYGKASKKQKQMYEAVLESQQAAVTYIEKQLAESTPIRAAAVDQIARDYLLSQGYPSIPHSLGHGIGLEVHEAPRLSPKSVDILEEDMVFSIEPGVYVPNEIGIRIEDLYVIRNNSLLQLTKAPSHLLER